MMKMKTYQYELDEQEFDPKLEQMGTIQARNDKEAIDLCKAIARRHKLPLDCVYDVSTSVPRDVYANFEPAKIAAKAHPFSDYHRTGYEQSLADQ